MANEVIIVGVDAAWGKTRALDFGIDEALVRQMPLRAVHVVESRHSNEDAYGPVKFDGVSVVPVRIDEAAARVVEEVRAQLAKIETKLDLDVDQRVGKPEDVLVDLSASATMLVLGRRGRGVFADLLIGSTSEAVANRGRGPVVVVPTGWDRPAHSNDPVLVGVDWLEPDPDQPAIEFAADHAASHGVPLTFVLVWDFPWVVASDQPVSAQDIEQWHDMTDARGTELVEHWRTKRTGIQITHHLYQGHAVEGLLAVAENLNAQLLAVGGRRRSRAAERLLGSTARGILQHTTHPIAIVHERPSD
jgi:nucleotide-binding universal stress UspA family protein